MTKTLESFFGFDTPPEDPPTIQPIEAQEANLNTPIVSHVTVDMGNRVDIALPTVTDMESSERELDELAVMAKDQSERLMDLGFNVDDRNAGLIFTVAAQLLNTAVAARTSKLDKKLKMIKLQLLKAKLDSDKKEAPNVNVVDATEVGFTGNRNDIVKAILNGVGQHK